MFARSAAPDTQQGKAIQAVNETWGQVLPRLKRGRETIGIPVCKKKYAPFLFSLDNNDANDNIKVQRMYACPCHDELRKASMIKAGGKERPGWQPFGQWSLKKAQELARRETRRMRQSPLDSNGDRSDEETASLSSSSLSSVSLLSSRRPTKRRRRECATGFCQLVVEDTPSSLTTTKTTRKTTTTRKQSNNNNTTTNNDATALKLRLSTLCNHGNCLWKVKSAFDDIEQELKDEMDNRDNDKERDNSNDNDNDDDESVSLSSLISRI